MRGVMLFAAGLFAGLALQVMTAQNTNSGVVMMNHHLEFGDTLEINGTLIPRSVFAKGIWRF